MAGVECFTYGGGSPVRSSEGELCLAFARMPIPIGGSICSYHISLHQTSLVTDHSPQALGLAHDVGSIRCQSNRFSCQLKSAGGTDGLPVVSRVVVRGSCTYSNSQRIAEPIVVVEYSAVKFSIIASACGLGKADEM